MSSDERILKQLDDEGVLLLTLNRPRRKNAFDEAQWDALADAIREANQGIRALPWCS
jgi:enoyl-CoA hydratase/carnithine racemase